LASRFYQNPFDWKRIWEGNRELIQNPDLIYPSQRFHIPGREMARPLPPVPPPAEPATAEVLPEEPAPAEPEPEPEEKPEPAPEKVPVPSPYGAKTMTSNTMMADAKWKGDGQIISDVAKKALISQYDMVYLNIGSEGGAVPRRRGDIYRKAQKVRAPQSGRPLGVVYRRVGVIEITQDVQKKSSAAVVVTSHEPVKIGDIIKLRD